MTDFILYKGDIVYQMTYKYSDKQNGFTEDYKYISSDNYYIHPSAIINNKNNIIINQDVNIRAGAILDSSNGKILIKKGIKVTQRIINEIKKKKIKLFCLTEESMP